MTTENTGEAISPKMFTEEEVQSMMKERLERESESKRLQREENERLKRQLDELHRKVDKGTASVDEMAQVQAADNAAHNAQAQGMTYDQARKMVKHEMQLEEFHSKLQEAHDKDPEFARLVKEGNRLYQQEVNELSYLPNAPAVIKYLLKDPKAFNLLRTATEQEQYPGGINFKMIANNISDKLESMQEKPAPSQFKPAEKLPDANDEDQTFDESSYISSKY